MKKYLILPLFLFLALTAQMCGTKTNEQPEETIVTPTNEEPQLDYYLVTNEAQSLQKAKERFNLAFEKAREWQTEVDLMLVSVVFNRGLSDVGVYDRFLFSSDLDTDLYFIIDILRDDPSVFTRTLVYRNDYNIKSDVLPIPVQYWKMSVEKTLEQVDSQGGAQFRADNSAYQVDMMLSLAGGRNLAWYVVYSAPGVTPFEKIIDANYGMEISDESVTDTVEESDNTLVPSDLQGRV